MVHFSGFARKMNHLSLCARFARKKREMWFVSGLCPKTNHLCFFASEASNN
ncbi:MAG: hypothetical protein U5L45_00650 [Saprospiraceae bacterium]|nr:hypothetical protein [Saprospiraceae bacterium]